MRYLGWVLVVPIVLCLASDSPSGQLEGRQGRTVDSERAAAVREAMLGIYVHGVTEELARAILTREDVPLLIDLLREPSFRRRDNAAAFLAMLDEGSATGDLLSFLVAPPVDVDVPEELRAMIVAPQALGRIAARGDMRALDALLAMTRDGGEGGPFLAGARRSRQVERVDDVLESALRGLALSGSDAGRRRLEEVARGSVRPRSSGREMGPAASRELDYFDTLHPGRHRRGPRAGGVTGSLSGAPGSSMAATAPPAPGNLMDTTGVTNASSLTYANHTAVSNKMNDARLDLVLRESELRAGREDFAADVMCCITVDRSGTAQTLTGAGLDVIDSSAELNAVLDNGVSRVKVVNAINFCGTPGTNILGCAWISGHGIALVRMSLITDEAVLWLHEYGHNVGLSHAGTNQYIMFSFLSSGAGGLTQAECNSYHNPTDGTSPPVTGVCADSDGDKIHDLADNCRFLVNPTQLDTDSDGQGDPCDGDADSDGVADASDCMPLDLNLWSTPGEAAALTLTHGGGGTILGWNPPAAPGGVPSSQRYDVLRAAGATAFNASPVCLESDAGPDTTATTSLPPATIWQGEGAGLNFRFGASISAAGNINNDAYDDIVVGSPGFNDGHDLEGRVEVRFGSAGGPGPLWSYDSNFEFATLGTSVSGGGDFDNDGFDDIIVGAPTIFVGGAAFAFYGSGSGLPPAPDWSAGGGEAGISFGSAVAVAGDVDNDNYDDVVVGAPQRTVGFTAEGGAFLYRGSATGLFATSWTPVGGAAGAQFGASIAAAGDVNNDGFADVIVGAPNAASGQAGEGLAYVFMGSPSGLGAAPDQTLQVNQISAAFGWSVASAGDVNNDGFADVIVGAKEYDVDQTNEGAAFLFYGSAAGIDPAIGPPLHGDKGNADYGISVSSAGDYNGDGYDDVVVGASTTNNGIARAGRAYLYLGSPFGPTPFQVIEGEQQDAEFGVAVARAGDTDGDLLDDFVAAAHLYDNGQTNEGFARVSAGGPGPDPLLGTIHYFLVRAQNACGAGPIGFSSSGSPISASDCTLE